MSAEDGSERQDSPLHTYFVDETGDGVIFDGRGRMLVGTGKVQDYFTLGMVECWRMDELTSQLADLRTRLLADPYFKGVPRYNQKPAKPHSSFMQKTICRKSAAKFSRCSRSRRSPFMPSCARCPPSRGW